MSLAEEVARLRGRIPVGQSFTAEFVQMVGNLAEVNIGSSTVQIPTVGYSPPIPGMSVQVEYRNGRYTVMGPAVPLPPKGIITTEGTPQAEVTAGGRAYLLPYYSNYTPALGDVVGIDWTKDNGVIQGKFTTEQTPVVPPSNGTDDAQSFADLLVRAESSGRYQSSWWGNSDVWASNSNKGIWTYGSRVTDALRGSQLTKIEIFLPLQTKRGVANIGVHSYGSIPGGSPSIDSLIPLNERSGWVGLPIDFGNFLRDNTGGIGVTSGSGYNIWSGVGSDPLSGALRFSGSR